MHVLPRIRSIPLRPRFVRATANVSPVISLRCSMQHQRAPLSPPSSAMSQRSSLLRSPLFWVSSRDCSALGSPSAVSASIFSGVRAKHSLKPIRIALAAMLGVLLMGFALPANAAVIYGYTGSAVRSDAGSAMYYHLGTGIVGTMKYGYIAINDNAQTGYLTNIQIGQCDNAAYTSGCVLFAKATAGATTSDYAVSLTGSVRRVVTLDFSCWTVAGAGSCVAMPAFDSTKYYYLFTQASQNQNSPYGTNRSVIRYGSGTLLYDASGNVLDCSGSLATFDSCRSSGGLGTPFELLTTSALSAAEQSASLGFTVDTDNWLAPVTISTSSAGSYFGLSPTSTRSVDESIVGRIINGITGVGLYLFSPWDETTANAWNNFRNSFGVHVPFSYVSETTTILSGLSVASGSLPSWTYSNPSLGIVSASFFSSTTLTTYAPSGFLSALRTLAAAALWFAFLWYVYHEARLIFG